MRHSHLTVPVVLAAHGSPDPRSAPVVRDIARSVGAHATFLDFDTPSTHDLLAALAAAGHDRAILVPLLLTDAYHRRVDIPRVVHRIRCDTGMECSVTATVGGERLVPSMVRALPASCDAVVLAAAGSRDGAAVAAVGRVASAVSAVTGLPCRAAFAAAAEPTVDEAIAILRAQGARSVAVASYFIAPGALHDRIRNRAAEAGCPVTPVLGACAELVATVVERYSSVSMPVTPSQSRDERTTNRNAVAMPRAQAPAPHVARSA